MTNHKKKPELLLIEDNEGDAILAKEAIAYNKSDIILRHVYDSVEAFSELFDRNYKPDLILMDLNLPGMNGIEILQVLKKDPRTEKIPVIVFSMSNNESDISKCYQLKAESFITKPIDLGDFFEVFNRIDKIIKKIIDRGKNE